MYYRERIIVALATTLIVGFAVGATASAKPKLTAVYVIFHTLEDGKDAGTPISAEVLYGEANVATGDSLGVGQAFAPQTTSARYPLKVLYSLPAKLIAESDVCVNIPENTTKPWSLKADLEFHYSNGKTLVRKFGPATLSTSPNSGNRGRCEGQGLVEQR